MAEKVIEEVLLAEKKTPFQKIELTRVFDGNVALYLDGAIQFVSGLDDKVYHGVLASLPAKMLQGRPGSALILGGGDGLAARNLLKFPNIREIRMVEIDPQMVEFCSTHPVMRKLNEDSFRNPRLKVETTDAREWVARPPVKKYDLAILDFPDPLEPSLENLFSGAFYKQVKNHLSGPSIWSIQSSSAFSGVEDVVTKNIFWATQTWPRPVRFKGDWMQDGSIVYAGRGVVPAMAQIPKDIQAKRPAVKPLAGLGMASIF